MKFYEYDTTTGKIHGNHGRPGWELPALAPGRALVLTNELQHSKYIRVSDGAIMDKQNLSAVWSKTSIVANGVDQAVLVGLPDPCPISIDGTEIQANGELQFAADTPGYYKIIVDHPHYFPEEWEIEAT